MNLLLDTSVLIDALRARNQRREFLAALVRAGHTLSTTALNIAELYSGMRPGEEPRTEAFLSGILCFGLSENSARHAGKWKFAYSQKGRTIALTDALIAAIAIEQHCQLLTDNRKDFPMPDVNLYPLP
jgi:predicted nucleic acid-binding protein